MKVLHYQGAIADVPKDKAQRLVASGSWTYVDVPAEAPEAQPEGDDTGDTVEPVQDPSEAQEQASDEKAPPTIPEIREWALKNNIEGVKPKGKLARTVIDAYLEAHKE